MKDTQERARQQELFSTDEYREAPKGRQRGAPSDGKKGIGSIPEAEPENDFMIRYLADLRKGKKPYDILKKFWLDGVEFEPQDCFALGRVALDRKDYALAREAYEALLTPSRFSEPVPEDFQLRIRKYLKQVERAEKAARKRSERRSKPSRQKQSNTGSPASAKVSPPAASTPVEEPRRIVSEEDLPSLEIRFETDSRLLTEAVKGRRLSDLVHFDLAMQAYRHAFRVSYDQLLCVSTLRNVEFFAYQEETARKVMKDFRGRAILADEVGLGKTIEAGLVLKEYIMRGLVRSVLIITPSSLVNQWRDELQDKFDLAFSTTNDPEFRDDPAQFWNRPFIIASLSTARSSRHFDAVATASYDIVIVDEAHHLKNQATRSWKLVNSLQKTFILLLTATPVQNNLEELYNLVTVLRPGHLKTRKAFKEEFVTRGNPTDPQNRERLRHLLKEVMIRNTRSTSQVRMPPRFATVTRISASESEETFYQGVSEFVSELSALRKTGTTAMAARKLLEAAGSSHNAALRTLEKMQLTVESLETLRSELVALGKKVGSGSKVRKVLDLLKSSPDRKIVFVNYLATLEALKQALDNEKISYRVFHGGLTPAQKKKAIEEFRSDCRVLLSTGSGGEGHNLQFCHVMVNYDLPWNPMEIEQRIGRIHRIGQTEEVFVHNFCAAGTIEDHILTVLDRKINMFELVVGEIDMILGRLQDERDFGDMVFEIWTKHRDEAGRSEAFQDLGTRLQRAKRAYEKSKDLDEKLFHEDFNV